MPETDCRPLLNRQRATVHLNYRKSVRGPIEDRPQDVLSVKIGEPQPEWE